MTVEMAPEDMTEEQVSELKIKRETEKDRAKLDAEANAFLLSSRPGRRMLYRMLENCGMFRDCVAATPEASLVLIGGHVKAVALWGDLVSTSPRHVALMIEENAR